MGALKEAGVLTTRGMEEALRERTMAERNMMSSVRGLGIYGFQKRQNPSAEENAKREREKEN